MNKINGQVEVRGQRIVTISKFFFLAEDLGMEKGTQKVDFWGHLTKKRAHVSLGIHFLQEVVAHQPSARLIVRR